MTHFIIIYVFISLKIADFDQCRKIDGVAQFDMTAAVGTYNYLPPELTMQPGRHTFAVDVYSAGIVFLELFLQETPYFVSILCDCKFIT